MIMGYFAYARALFVFACVGALVSCFALAACDGNRIDSPSAPTPPSTLAIDNWKSAANSAVKSALADATYELMVADSDSKWNSIGKMTVKGGAKAGLFHLESQTTVVTPDTSLHEDVSIRSSHSLLGFVSLAHSVRGPGVNNTIQIHEVRPGQWELKCNSRPPEQRQAKSYVAELSLFAILPHWLPEWPPYRLRDYLSSGDIPKLCVTDMVGADVVIQSAGMEVVRKGTHEYVCHKVVLRFPDTNREVAYYIHDKAVERVEYVGGKLERVRQ